MCCRFNRQSIPINLNKSFQFVYRHDARAPYAHDCKRLEWVGSLRYVIEFRLFVVVYSLPKTFPPFSLYYTTEVRFWTYSGSLNLSVLPAGSLHECLHYRAGSFATRRGQDCQFREPECHGLRCWLLGVNVAGSWCTVGWLFHREGAGTPHLTTTLPKLTRERERERGSFLNQHCSPTGFW